MDLFSLSSKKNVCDQALQFAEQMRAMERKTPKMALKSTESLKARSFYKSIPENLKNERSVVLLNRELLAYKLGIRSEFFDANSGFQNFAEETRLYNYLDKYNHSLKTLEDKKIIQIKCDGAYVSWENVLPEIKAFPKGGPEPQQLWKYGETGLINKDLYKWEKLEPIYTDKAISSYRFSICTTCVDQARIQGGDHAYIKLYDGETGQVYAAGLYSNRITQDKDPLSVKAGFLMIDVSEFWGVDIQEISIAITKEQFLAVKGKIEADKLKEKNQPFHLFEKNCTEYAVRVARIVGLSLPNKAPYFCFIFPRKFVKNAGAVFDQVPLIKRICLFVLSIFSNIFYVYLGGTRVDEKIQGSASPAIKSWRDFFDCSKLNMHSPFILAHDVREEIENWRKSKISSYLTEMKKLDPSKHQAHIAQKIAKLQKKQLKVAYKVPKRFRCAPAAA